MIARLSIFLLALCLAALPAHAATLAGAEWFRGADPGAGNGTAVAAADGAYDSSAEEIVQQVLAVAALETGVHRLGLRFQDTDGNWGNAAYLDVEVVDSASLPVDPLLPASFAGLRKIVEGELTVDGGAPVALTPVDGTFDGVAEETLGQVLGASSLSEGLHRMEVRFKDTDGNWGSAARLDVEVQDSGTLLVEPALPAGFAGLRKIAEGELTVDGGAPVALAAADGTFDGVVEETLGRAVASSGLNEGMHRVEVRFKDTDGNWGSAARLDVEVQSVPSLVVEPPLPTGYAGLRTIKAGELFIDIDPGEGAGTAVLPEDGTFDSVAEALQAVLVNPLNLRAGIRRVGLRFKNDAGAWGTPAFMDVEVIATGPEPPFILAQPRNLLLMPGGVATFSVTVVGDGPFTYQWRKDGVNVAGATGDNLSFANVTRSAAGNYTVVISNVGGEVESTAAPLRVLVPARLGALEKLAGGRFRLRFGDEDSVVMQETDKARYEAQVSTDLKTWSRLPGALVLDNGQLMIEEADAPQDSLRFYRVIQR